METNICGLELSRSHNKRRTILGFFTFNGHNSVYQDLIAQLPNGTVYLKQDNAVPFAMQVTFTELFPDSITYPVGTNVDIYVNNTFSITVKVLPDKAIYYDIPTPYGRFNVKTVVNGKTYSDDPFYSFNMLSFLVALSKTYDYDYIQIFNIFGNIYDPYLQNDMLYNKIGWNYDFGLPSGWSIDEYGYILRGALGTTTNEFGGNNYPINWLFVNSMTYWSMRELILSFTGQYPTIYTYRDENGWILVDDAVVQNPNFKNYYLVEDWNFTGVNNMAGADLNGYNLVIQIDATEYTINFTTTTGGASIVSQINAIVTSTGFLASVVTSGSNEYVKLHQSAVVSEMVIKGGSAVAPLGLSVLQFQQDDFVDTDSDIITLWDERYLWNKIDLIINNGSKLITETVTKSNIDKDKLRHKNVIDTPLHTLSISGYVKGVDYTLIEYPALSTEYYINWLNPNVYVQGTANVVGVNLAGKTLVMNVNNVNINMTFNTTTTASDIVNQIAFKFGGTIASVVVVGAVNYIRLDGWSIRIIGGTALPYLGFTVGQKVGIPQKNEQYVVIYSYFIKEEIEPLINLNKPAYLRINLFYNE